MNYTAKQPIGAVEVDNMAGGSADGYYKFTEDGVTTGKACAVSQCLLTNNTGADLYVKINVGTGATGAGSDPAAAGDFDLIVFDNTVVDLCNPGGGHRINLVKYVSIWKVAGGNDVYDTDYALRGVIAGGDTV